MKRIFSFLLLIACLAAHSQNTERVAYYYQGKKISFQLNYERLLIQLSPAEMPESRRQQIATILDLPGNSLKQIGDQKQLLVSLPAGTSMAATKQRIANLRKQGFTGFVHPAFKSPSGKDMGYGENLVVKLKAGTSVSALEQVVKKNNCHIVKKYAFTDNIYIIAAGQANSYDALTTANLLFETGLFVYAEPDLILFEGLAVAPNDPLFGYQWGQLNTGTAIQYNGTAGTDMKVQQAWNITKGAGIKVAVIDQGVDLTHPDLQANLLQGFDAISGTANAGDGKPLAPANGHGTSCAGIIAAVANNNIGIAGVAPESKIIPINVVDASGVFVSYTGLASAFDYAWQHAADVISNSWGGGSPSQLMDDAITRALTQGRSGKGCVVLFASGNDNSSISYPSSNPGVICVGGVNMCGQRKSPGSCDGETWWGANYGNGLDIVAPCVKIATTDISGSAGYNTSPGTDGNYIAGFNGTSSATPNAAAVAALILAANNGLTTDQARKALEASCAKLPGYTYSAATGQPNGSWNNETGYGAVDAYQALLLATSTEQPGTGLQAQYFNGTTLSGTALLTRTDATVNLLLTYSTILSPAPGIVPTDSFSARWTGQVKANYTETYTFYTLSDDGIRLWVNGVQLIDNWVTQGPTEKSNTINLVAGQKYDIKIEYFENTGESTAKLSWSSASTPKEIVPQRNLYPQGTVQPNPPACAVNTAPANGSTVAAANAATLNWSTVANASSYDVYLWTGNTSPATPSSNVTNTTYTATGLSAGTIYNWYVTPKNAGGAAIGCIGNKTSFTTAAATITGTGLQGVYYSGTAPLTGTPLLTRVDPTINMLLTYATVLSPAPGIVPNDNFSIRWTGQVKADYTETYTFYTLADDGIRLWVNGVQLIDNWVQQGPTEKSGTINLVAGEKYDIKIEYFEWSGESTAKLLWSSPSTSKALVPQANLYPAAMQQTPPLTCTTNTSPANGSSIATATTATLSWNAVSNASYYNVFLWAGTTAPVTPIANVVGNPSYLATGLTASTLYNWYVVPVNAGEMPTGCITNKTTFSTAAPAVKPGTGLQGSYYNGIALAGTPLLSRVDSTVNMLLTYATVLSPAPGIVPNDAFSIRWTGQVRSDYTENYTFYTLADDGIRLWVNGVLLIDNWTLQGPTEKSGSIGLVAGQQYDIKIEYFENTGESTAKLSWSSASTPKTLVPKINLYTPVPTSGMSTSAGIIDPSAIRPIVNPNPVKRGQEARLKIYADKAGSVGITFLSGDGHIISNQKFNALPGINSIAVGTAHLAQGLYMIAVSGMGKPATIKLMVIN